MKSVLKSNLGQTNPMAARHPHTRLVKIVVSHCSFMVITLFKGHDTSITLMVIHTKAFWSIVRCILFCIFLEVSATIEISRYSIDILESICAFRLIPMTIVVCKYCWKPKKKTSGYKKIRQQYWSILQKPSAWVSIAEMAIRGMEIIRGH